MKIPNKGTRKKRKKGKKYSPNDTRASIKIVAKEIMFFNA